MINLFEQFEGKDLDRLAVCLKAIRQAGLKITKHTQAGVNQNSGNVWVWDEDWVGCVACSINFNVHWWHSCPECGHEENFDTYEDLTEYVEAYNFNCMHCFSDAN